MIKLIKILQASFILAFLFILSFHYQTYKIFLANDVKTKYSIYIDPIEHNHTWVRTEQAYLFKKQSDLFAIVDGKRACLQVTTICLKLPIRS